MDTTKSIAIYGKSGHGKVVADIARLNGFETIIWVDDNVEEAIAFDEYLANHSDVKMILAIGKNQTRTRLSEKLQSQGVTFITLIHPSAVISSSVTIGEGTVIMPNVVINADATIGSCVILNTASVIEHDCIIEDFTHISPNVSLAGNIHVKQCAHVGIGASVIQGICIGSDSIIGAGSVVIHNIDDDVIAVGVPAFYKKRIDA